MIAIRYGNGLVDMVLQFPARNKALHVPNVVMNWPQRVGAYSFGHWPNVDSQWFVRAIVGPAPNENSTILGRSSKVFSRSLPDSTEPAGFQVINHMVNLKLSQTFGSDVQVLLIATCFGHLGFGVHGRTETTGDPYARAEIPTLVVAARKRGQRLHRQVKKAAMAWGPDVITIVDDSPLDTRHAVTELPYIR